MLRNQRKEYGSFQQDVRLAEKGDNMKKSNDNFAMKKEYDLSIGTRGRFYSPKKISTTIRLDDDVLLYLKKLASIKKIRYQTLLNSILRDYVQKVAQ
jgi:uncharacterized protein (DUF4415 family)